MQQAQRSPYTGRAAGWKSQKTSSDFWQAEEAFL
jgi:hypothetical protein